MSPPPQIPDQSLFSEFLLLFWSDIEELLACCSLNHSMNSALCSPTKRVMLGIIWNALGEAESSWPHCSAWSWWSSPTESWMESVMRSVDTLLRWVETCNRLCCCMCTRVQNRPGNRHILKFSSGSKCSSCSWMTDVRMMHWHEEVKKPAESSFSVYWKHVWVQLLVFSSASVETFMCFWTTMTQPAESKRRV